MMERTARLGLPVLVPGQGQKDVTHNEALMALDALVQLAVVDWELFEPPLDAVFGDFWIVPAGAVGAWAGRESSVAQWTPGGWRFVAATAGMSAWLAPKACRLQYSAGTWLMESAIEAPTGGTVVDVEDRAALANIVLAMERLGLIDH